MGWFFNKLTTERVYEALKVKVYAMNVLGYPESSQICDDFKPAESNYCNEDSCQFVMKVKYGGKWDLEFRFDYSKRHKAIRASVYFKNLVLYGNRNDATDELRENIQKELNSKTGYGDQYVIDYYETYTVVYLAERKIKELADVGKYVFNFQVSWNHHKIIDVLTAFKTSKEIGLGCIDNTTFENESVEIDGISIDDL